MIYMYWTSLVVVVVLVVMLVVVVVVVIVIVIQQLQGINCLTLQSIFRHVISCVQRFQLPRHLLMAMVRVI